VFVVPNIDMLKTVKVYGKLSEAKQANLPNTLLQPTNRKTLRAGIDDQKGRRGAGHCA
jgi:hypothetical protein